MYITNCNRSDIAYVVDKFSRFTSNLTNDYWKALISVLRYLWYITNIGLHYTRYLLVLEGYNDTNWTLDTKDSKFPSCYVFIIGGAAVSWKSSKQIFIAQSTMKSEFITLDKVGEKAKWLRNFLEDISCWPKPTPTISMHCDSQSTIELKVVL